MPSLNYGPVTQAGYRISQKIGYIVQPQLTTTSSWNVPPRPRVRKGLSFFKAQVVSLSATTLSSMWGEPTWSKGTAKKRRKTHQETESKEASDRSPIWQEEGRGQASDKWKLGGGNNKRWHLGRGRNDGHLSGNRSWPFLPPKTDSKAPCHMLQRPALLFHLNTLHILSDSSFTWLSP